MNKCIECGTTPAYISFMGKCECSNTNCKFYSRDLYPPPVVNSSRPTDPAPPNQDYNKMEDEETEMSPMYIWATHHHDFGDV